MALLSDYAAFKKAKFENHGVPDALVTPDEVIGEEERDRLETQWNQRFRRGGSGRRVERPHGSAGLVQRLAVLLAAGLATAELRGMARGLKAVLDSGSGTATSGEAAGNMAIGGRIRRAVGARVVYGVGRPNKGSSRLRIFLA